DHRADIYAWGVVAWELLAGRHPFDTKRTPQALLAAHMAERPESLDRICVDLPIALTSLVARALEKDPARRPATAAELIVALDNVGTPAASTGSALWASRSRHLILSAIGVVLVIAAAFSIYSWRGASATTADTARTIVVVPFENLGPADDAYFADGVTEEIAGQLARIPGLLIVARASVQKFRGSSTPPQEIARQLGAAYALSGTIRWARGAPGKGATVRIVPSLVRANSGKQVWGEPLQENIADVFKAQADIAERVSSALSVTIGASYRAALRRPESTDAEAREAVMLGFRLVQRRGLVNIKQAIVQFDRAIARDSMYARAWAGKAEGHGLLPAYFDTATNKTEAFAIAERAARRAMALDSLLPESHSALATVISDRPNEALRATERAIALDPGSAMAHSRRGTLLLMLGRVAEAEAPFRRAIALDPLVSAHTARLGWWFLATGQVDSMAAALRRAVELDPANTVLSYLGAVMFAHLGRLDDAVQLCAAYSGRPESCAALWRG
ncbi:MAG TPA: tetratricopeptide repeat protein, partial [Gemmatimonadaceae bacterium]